MIRIRQMLAGAMLVLLSVLVLVRTGEAQWQVSNHSIPVGTGGGTGFRSAGPCASGGFLVWSSGATVDPTCSTAANSVATLTGSMTITPGSGLRNGLIVGPQTITGTQVGNLSVNGFVVTSDNAALGSDGSTIGALLNLHYEVGGSAMKGSRFGLVTSVTFNGPSHAANTNMFVLAHAPTVVVATGDGGTDTGAGARGSFVTENPVAKALSGATNLVSLGVSELNVSLPIGATAGYKYIAALVSLGTDTKQADGEDTMLTFSAISGAVGAKDALRFTDRHGQFPTTATGNLISTSGGNAKYGFDGVLTTFASGFLRSTGFLVDPTGGITGLTFNKVTITAPATAATLTIDNNKTLRASNTLTFTGTDGSSVAFGTGGTVAYVANKLSVFAATTSAELAGVISDETGSGALVFGTSPTLTTAVAAGTWTASGTWTLPAFTLGGTVSGGGNQINNVIIGTSTPLAGFFTTLSASTSITSSLHIGGSATNQASTSKTTTGVGSGDTHAWTGGNNGADTRMTLSAAALTLGAGVNNLALGDAGGTSAVIAPTGGAATNVSLFLRSKGVGDVGIQNASAGLIASFSNAAGAGASTNNYLIVNSTTGNPVAFGVYAAGSVDTNVGMAILSKGTGTHRFTDDSFVNRMVLSVSGTATTNTATGTATIIGGLGIGGAVAATLANTLQANTVCYNIASGLFTYQVGANCTTSSARFKDHIAEISRAESLERVMRALPVSYRYRAEFEVGTDERIGFTAEQIEHVDPRLVVYESDGKTPRSVRYAEFTSLLAGAIQQLKADNDNLQAELQRIAR